MFHHFKKFPVKHTIKSFWKWRDRFFTVSPCSVLRGEKVRTLYSMEFFEEFAAEKHNIWTQVDRCKDHPLHLMIGVENRILETDGTGMINAFLHWNCKADLWYKISWGLKNFGDGYWGDVVLCYVIRMEKLTWEVTVRKHLVNVLIFT